MHSWWLQGETYNLMGPDIPGFTLSRTDGSHHIFTRPDIPELVNLQNIKGQAKPYQIRQFLKLVETHNLKLKENE